MADLDAGGFADLLAFAKAPDGNDRLGFIVRSGQSRDPSSKSIAWPNKSQSDGWRLSPFPLSDEMNVRELALGDVNGDTAPDLVLSSGTDIVIYLGTGLGGFEPAPSIRLSGAHEPVLAVGDMSGDCMDEVAVGRGMEVELFSSVPAAGV